MVSFICRDSDEVIFISQESKSTGDLPKVDSVPSLDLDDVEENKVLSDNSDDLPIVNLSSRVGSNSLSCVKNKFGEGSSSTSLCDEEKLLSIFSEQMTSEQIMCVYHLSDCEFNACMDCLLAGPTSESILKLLQSLYEEYFCAKVNVDEDDMWCDLVSFYKGSTPDPRMCRIRICLTGQAPIDTGGVRRQLYTTVFQEFANNKHIKLFDGPLNSLRPLYSAQARSSGLFKVLGKMVGHSLVQDGIGFPYFSPLCFWYIAAGEEAAMQHVSFCDVDSATVDFISKVF